MRVGILTFHDGINYGAFFQTLALQEHLRSRGADAHVIDYKNPGFARRERGVFLRASRPLASWRNARKIVAFRRAQRRHLRLTRRCRSMEDLRERVFDTVVLGSDEIWNYASPLIGFDSVYFGCGVPAQRRVAYAASFGSVGEDSDPPPRAREGIAGLAAVSVRDAHSLRLARRIREDDVEQVLDPVFFLDPAAWDTPDAPGQLRPPYLMVYGFDFSDEMIAAVRTMARSRGWRLVSVGYAQRWCDDSLDGLDPFSWLHVMRNASAVVTTMYHGVLLSLRCQRPFALVPSPYRQHKFSGFLQEAGLTGKAIGPDHGVEAALDAPADAPETRAFFESRLQRSKVFLERAVLAGRVCDGARS